jgi:excinuclease UvrABC nuclease subunit
MSTTSMNDQLQPWLKANRRQLDDLLSQLLKQPAYTYQDVKEHKALAPARHQYGVYHFFQVDESDVVTSIYVGESHTLSEDAGLANRIDDHFRQGHPDMGNLPGNLVRAGHASNRAAAVDIVRNHYRIQYLVLSTPVDARALEHYAIALLLPYYNYYKSVIGSEAQPLETPAH